MKAAGAALAGTGVARGQSGAVKKVDYRGARPKSTPLVSRGGSYGSLLFIAGKGAHFEGDIKAHTTYVRDKIKKELTNVGCFMEKVLKCNVYLNDLNDWQAMNDVFRRRFGLEPPVRTTIAASGGIPGNSLVEIDVIAFIGLAGAGRHRLRADSGPLPAVQTALLDVGHHGGGDGLGPPSLFQLPPDFR